MDELDIRHCRSCGDSIVWLRTATGQFMPVNVDSAEPGDVTYIPGKHVSHFATCPHSNQWRKK